MQKVSDSAKTIAKHLLEIGAVQFNVKDPFTWVSGIKSPVYCDNRKINSYTAIRSTVAQAFVQAIQSQFPATELIAGVATGGIPQGILVADRMQLPFVYVRQAPKEHGMKRQVEGDCEAGQKTLVIEDHISTGGSSIKAVNGLRNEHLEIVGLISIMTYGFEKATQLFELEKVPYMSLCNLDTVLEVATTAGFIGETEKNSVLKFRTSPADWWQG